MGGDGDATHPGPGGADLDPDGLFGSIDRAVLEHHSRPTRLPLILAALPADHHRFVGVSKNPFLLSQGIMVSPSHLTNEALRTLAWRVVEPRYEARLEGVMHDFETARADGRGSSNLLQISAAAASGRIATLFIGAERGRLDDGAGEGVAGAPDDPDIAGVLDSLCALVGKMGGEVLVIPPARMPAGAGLAAIYQD